MLLTYHLSPSVVKHVVLKFEAWSL